jgi:hypothetical protein
MNNIAKINEKLIETKKPQQLQININKLNFNQT